MIRMRGVLAGAAAMVLAAPLVVGIPQSAAAVGASRALGAPVAPHVDPNAPEPVKLLVESNTYSKKTYGVGLIITLTFNRSVPMASRAAVVNALKVETSKPIGDAGWAWQTSRVLMFRPKAFYPGSMTVKVRGEFIGLDLGTVTMADGSKRPLVGGRNFARDYTIGRSQIINVNGKSHHATVRRDGKVIRTMGVSLGKKGWETRSGIKTLMESYRTIKMTSANIGAEEFYETDVKWAVRMTTSGEFMHAAPWAAGRIGYWNGSHGCTNLFTSDAKWLFYNYLSGDPVITTGTGRGPTGPWNGYGGPWNSSWTAWKAGKVV